MIDARILVEIGLKSRFGSKFGTLAKGSCLSASLPKLECTCSSTFPLGLSALSPFPPSIEFSVLYFD
jgi:hypothetical protein